VTIATLSFSLILSSDDKRCNAGLPAVVADAAAGVCRQFRNLPMFELRGLRHGPVKAATCSAMELLSEAYVPGFRTGCSLLETLVIGR
jgi:hypothetical protein